MEGRQSIRKALEKRALLANAAILVIIGGLATALYIVANAGPRQGFTEFYILGRDGEAAGYPQNVRAGEIVGVIVGITNHEGAWQSYLLQVVSGSHVLHSESIGPLAPEERWEREVTFRIENGLSRFKVDFELYKPSDSQPYRRLHLWLNMSQ